MLHHVLAQVDYHELPPALQWLIIVALAGITWLAFKRWVDRLDKMLEKLDTAIDGINQTLARFGEVQKNHGNDISDLKHDVRELKDKPKRR